MKSSVIRSSLALALLVLLGATAAAAPQFGDIFKKKKKDQSAQSEQKSENKKDDKKPEEKKSDAGGGIFGVRGATGSKQSTDTTAMAAQGVGEDGKVTAEAIAAEPTAADLAEVQKVASTTVKQEDLQKFVQEGNLKVRGGGD